MSNRVGVRKHPCLAPTVFLNVSSMSPFKCLFEIYEDKFCLFLKVPFTQDSEVKDLFCGVSPGSEPRQFFSENLFSLEFSPVQDDI